MKSVGYLSLGSAILLTLGGCGGGSSQGPSAIPAPLAPAQNTTMTNLTQSQSFTNNAATLTGTWDVSTGTASTGSAKQEALSIHYNADTKSYTLQAAGRSQTFAPADRITPEGADQARYRKELNEQTERTSGNLELFLENAELPRYVKMAIWQHNLQPSATRQDTQVSMLAYGLPTVAVPLTGTASYRTTVFGTVTAPGEQPVAFSGPGRFTARFNNLSFYAESQVSEYGLIAGQFGFGGIGLAADGKLSADGSFSGTSTYISQYGRSTGTINGRLYGPAADEVGAAFATYGSNGVAAAGAFIGRVSRNTSYPADTSLPGMRQANSFATISTSEESYINWNSSKQVAYGDVFNQNHLVNGTNPNIIYYEKYSEDYNGKIEIRRLHLYKFESANSELQLCYTSFGSWQNRYYSTKNGYFTYGFPTAPDLLAARSGTAHYEGVSYGTGTNSTTASVYDIKGSSAFQVDFSTHRFDAELSLRGAEQNTGTAVDFGIFTVNGQVNLSESVRIEGNAVKGGAVAGSFRGNFYGPNAQELSGVFNLETKVPGQPGAVKIEGATVAVHK